jgi:AcrR family transcriptional regulator
LSDGVLYNHFEDKEQLLAEALLAHVEAVMSSPEPLPEAGQGSVEANLHTYITWALSVLVRILPPFAGLLSEPHVIARFHRLSYGGEGAPALPDALSRYLRAEQQLGRIDPSADIDAAAAMLIGACHDLLIPRLLFGIPSTEISVPDGFADGLVSTIMRGIAPAI